MVKNKTSIKFSIGVCMSASAALLFLTVCGPWLFELYFVGYRGFLPDYAALKMIGKVFACCFYPCVPLAGVVLYALLKMLFNIKNEQVFISQNATCLKIISYCLIVIGIITFIGGIFYFPFMFVSAAGLFTGILMRVLKNVFCSAIELREENDLTI